MHVFSPHSVRQAPPRPLLLLTLLGLLLPLLLHFRPLLGATSPVLAAILALAGGFALRWAIVMAAQGVQVTNALGAPLR